uniref:microfibril-associated glycoprotein 4-like n=1 Tax=Styela clava TaxID=7725 RepID=UPI001939DA6A|nr:microfibril-associated glycoprotein 4-like [Styela clava]
MQEKCNYKIFTNGYEIVHRSDCLNANSISLVSDSRVIRSHVSYRSKRCDQIYSDGYTEDGVYRIWLTHGYRFLSVFCDMRTVGAFSQKRGWMVIQKRLNGEVNFDRGWDDYVNGFGFPNMEYWIGLQNMEQLLIQKRIRKGDETNLGLRIDFTDWDGVSAFSETVYFYMNSVIDDFKVTRIGRVQGTAELRRPLASVVGFRFSTHDHNNDIRRDSKCVRDQRGGWWFGSCSYMNMNGIYSKPKETMSKSKIFVRFWKQLNPNNTALRYVSIKLQ